MNFSELKPQINTYLGFRGAEQDDNTEMLISECLAELEKLHRFRYLYESLSEIPAFLQKEPYASFLKDSEGVLLSAMTLGAEADRRIRYLERADLTRSVVFDACASALLESLSDEYEKAIEKMLGKPLTFRFCPGYGGSDVSDLRFLFERLHPEKIGITLLSSNYMLPCKSMAGVIGVGKTSEKSCGNCDLLPHCGYRKEGKRCYGSEKK